MQNNVVTYLAAKQIDDAIITDSNFSAKSISTKQSTFEPISFIALFYIG